MDFAHFTAGKNDAGRRIDKILRRFLNEKSLSGLYKSLRKGLVKLNGKKCEPDTKVFENDDIQIAKFLLDELKDEPEENDNKNNLIKKNDLPHGEAIARSLPDEMVLFRNEDLLILNKPYDICVQGGNGEISLSDLVQSDYDFYHQKTEFLSFKCGPLHRLDRKTSGIIVFSQSLKGARWFSDAIKAHKTRKIYLGICQGNLAENQDWKDEIIDNEKLAIDNGAGFKTVKVVRKDDILNSKTAITHAFPVAHGKFFGKEITLVKFEIETGRKHQIRSQSSFHGFPLLGDAAYGGEKIDSKKYGRDFFLHAYELDFPDYAEMNLPEKIICKIQDDFKNFLNFSLINENWSVKI